MTGVPGHRAAQCTPFPAIGPHPAGGARTGGRVAVSDPGGPRPSPPFPHSPTRAMLRTCAEGV